MPKLNHAFTLVLFLAAAFVPNGCHFGDSKNIPNVSGIDVQWSLQRFDHDLFSLDTNYIEAGMGALASQYPDFLPFFLHEIAHDQTNPKETPLDAMQGFVKATQVRRLNDSCQAVFNDLGWLKKELTQQFRFYKYYFPQRQTPRVVTAVTEFISDAYAVNDTLVMIGLDMFLGENFSGYNPDFFPQYIRRQFRQEYIPSKVALALSSRVMGAPPGDRIIDHMINNGKILYLVDCLVPLAPDSMKMGYTQAQIDGCYSNEQEVWARLLEMNVLYEPLSSKNQKIVMPSPAADNVFQEAPGEIGNWLGWQIVKAYMKRYPETTLQQLAELRDAQQLLEKARYRPKRQ